VRTRWDGVVVVRTGTPGRRATTDAVAPTNDTLSAATALAVPWNVPGSTREATADGDDQAAAAACAASGLGSLSSTSPSVWYSVTPASSVVLVPALQVTASASDYGYDVSADLAVFTRDAAGAFVAVACGNIEGGQTPRLEAGRTYYLQVFSTGGTADFVFTGRPPTADEAPANDAFASAVPLPLDKSVSVAHYDRAGLETGEPAPPCGPPSVGSVWFTVDPGSWNRLALLAPLDSETATLWRGGAPGSLSSLGCFAPPPPTNGSAPTTGGSARWAVAGPGPYYLQIALVSPAVETSKSFELTTDDSCSGRCLPPCTVRDYKVAPNTLPRDPWRWSFNVAGGLKGLSGRQVLRSVKAGAAIITTSKNDCGLADKVSAKTRYLGHTRAKASMCNGDRSDRRNVVAVAPRGAGSTLAQTCYRLIQSGGRGKWRITESDMEIYANWRWTTDGDAVDCHDQQDLVGVVAHEVGHVFALDHAERSRAGNLTMFPIAPPDCNASEASLGLGDVLALRKLY
jgi:hypothetical protein